MKSKVFQALLNTAVGMIACLPISASLGADASSTPTAEAATPQAAPAAAATQPAPAKLPYGAEDVVKLSNAQVSENVILTYIQNSGTIYNLSPQDIVNLRNQGVSDSVVTAMVDQRRNVTAAAAQTAPPATTQPAPVYTDSYNAAAPTYAQAPATYVEPGPMYVQPAPIYVQPPVTYVDPTYVDPAASTLYVIPYPAARYAYYGRPSSAGYGGSYGYYGCGPSVSVGFRFGGAGYYKSRCGWYGTRSGWHR